MMDYDYELEVDEFREEQQQDAREAEASFVDLLFENSTSDEGNGMAPPIRKGHPVLG